MINNKRCIKSFTKNRSALLSLQCNCWFCGCLIDFRDILYDILNGDGIRFIIKISKVYRKTANKFYPAFGHVWGASFDTFANNQIRGAMVEALGEIVNDCKTWNLVIDDLYYKKLIQSIDYERLLQSEL